MVILDELNIVLRYDYLPLADVVAELTQKRPMLHVVVTGVVPSLCFWKWPTSSRR